MSIIPLIILGRVEMNKTLSKSLKVSFTWSWINQTIILEGFSQI